MSMTQLAKPLATPLAENSAASAPRQSDSLFERLDWLYILCRERLFRDDTARMITALWPKGRPRRGEKLFELGCGPGFYSRALAARFPELEVRGLDRSHRQLLYAREKALHLPNCLFEIGDVINVAGSEHSFDTIIASRLFTILREPDRALGEMHRLLNAGGRCFIAEPRFRFWASLPLLMMWMVASISGRAGECCEPRVAQVFALPKFRRLIESQPWRSVRIWQDGRYQYALCEKG